MHVVGKILVWLVLPASIAAFVLSARLVDTRGKWLQQLQAIKQQNEKTASELASARLAKEQARENLVREMLRWDRVWSDVVGQFIPDGGGILAKVGTAAGIDPNMKLYAFVLSNDGTPSYVGPFTADQVQANDTALKALFRIRSEDASRWSGQRWRLRTMIPSSFASRIAHLETELVVADELLAKQTSNLETQNKLVETAREQRDTRIAELLGGAKNGQTALVAEITQAEDQRNKSLTGVDRLRRSIHDQLQRARALIQENNELARTLPGQSAPKEAAVRAANTSVRVQ